MLIIYATRLLLNAMIIMFAGFCDGGKSVEGPRRIIADQLSSRRFRGKSVEKNIRRTPNGERERGGGRGRERERERERESAAEEEGTRSRSRKTSTYELNYIRQSWRPITYSAHVTRDSNPD